MNFITHNIARLILITSVMFALSVVNAEEPACGAEMKKEINERYKVELEESEDAYKLDLELEYIIIRGNVDQACEATGYPPKEIPPPSPVNYGSPIQSKTPRQSTPTAPREQSGRYSWKCRSAIASVERCKAEQRKDFGRGRPVRGCPGVPYDCS